MWSRAGRLAKIALVLGALVLFANRKICAQGAYTEVISSVEPLPNCTPGGAHTFAGLIWDATAGTMDACTATNTWTPIAPTGIVTGTGTANTIPKWLTTSTIGNSTLTDDGTIVSLTTEGLSSGLAAPFTLPYQNDTSTGTVQYELVTVNSSGNAILPITGTISKIVGIAFLGAGTSGVVQVAQGGRAPCIFGNTAVPGDYVQPDGDGKRCHDAGATPPATAAEVLGLVSKTTATPPVGTSFVDVFSPLSTPNAASGSGVVATISEILGDSVSIAPTVPITSGSAQLNPALADPGYFVAGPIPNPGTNVAVVQTAVCRSASCTFAAPVTAGDTIATVEAVELVAPPTTASDSLGNTFTFVTSQFCCWLNPSFSVAYALNIGTGGNDTVSWNSAGGTCPAGGATCTDMEIVELSGVSAFDASAWGFTNSGSVDVSLSTSANSDGALVFGFQGNPDGAGFVCDPQGQAQIRPASNLITSDCNPANNGTDLYVGAFASSTGAAGTYGWTGEFIGARRSSNFFIGSENELLVMTFKQSLTILSAPLVQRPINQADLPTSIALTGTVGATQFTLTSVPLVTTDFALSAGWGNSPAPTVNSVYGGPQAFAVTIESGGAGQTANPTVTLTWASGIWFAPPAMVCEMSQAGAAGQLAWANLTWTVTQTALTITYNGTPGASLTGTISCVGFGT